MAARTPDEIHQVLRRFLALHAYFALPNLMASEIAPPELQSLNQETIELYRIGKYDRGVLVAKQALAFAELIHRKQ